MTSDVVGWISAAILVTTISRQVYTQWRTQSIAGVSKWLFVGQLVASMGFTLYSWLVDNWVFVFANFFIFLTAVAGECIYLRNKRLTERRERADEKTQDTQDTQDTDARHPARGGAGR
ncbi:MAG TPA: PQ-loop repeat-containing protein [Noviherbaspirillum sp.]|uniref:PQ-loop repeat-containing protein n=1 Tax=Noviherbaspirillum sp. TaxID=1926288 RepID=UPI002B489786|nr:PQ-loop repeat-containing protein [Noviherbaspirillum sp.]HJV86024.1 PQ-loop repeat-containing protein [Noviherbaspirillum sp.]